MPRRNYSFLLKRPDSFDRVERGKDVFIIPARIGSTYWAILKVMYERHDTPVHAEELCNQVAALMLDRDEAAWFAYIGNATVSRLGADHPKPVKDWRDRIICNARTLTRLGGNNPYGLRLKERGHQLCIECDANGKTHFILMTTEKDESANKDRPPARKRLSAAPASQPATDRLTIPALSIYFRMTPLNQPITPHEIFSFTLRLVCGLKLMSAVAGADEKAHAALREIVAGEMCLDSRPWGGTEKLTKRDKQLATAILASTASQI